MFLGVGVVTGLLLRLAVHGRLRGLGSLHLRGEGAFIGVFVSSLALPALPALAGERHWLVFPAWLLLMACVVALCLVNAAVNRGFGLLAAGACLNLLVILLNGAMPVSVSALRELTAGAAAPRIVTDVFHILASAGSLLLLADVLPLPGPAGLRSVQSVGDLVMLAAVAIIISSAPVPSDSDDSRTLRGA